MIEFCLTVELAQEGSVNGATPTCFVSTMQQLTHIHIDVKGEPETSYKTM